MQGYIFTRFLLFLGLIPSFFSVTCLSLGAKKLAIAWRLCFLGNYVDNTTYLQAICSIILMFDNFSVHLSDLFLQNMLCKM